MFSELRKKERGKVIKMKMKERIARILTVSAVWMLLMVSGRITDNAYAETKESVSDNESKAELSYWSDDSKAYASITEYVEKAVDPDSDGFIPVEDRLAVFDLDGTIIGELYPSYFEYMMFIHRALYDENYEAAPEMKEFAKALEEGIKTGKMPKNNETLHAKYAGRAYAGMTIDEMKNYVKDFMESKADGFTGLTRGDAFYKPMVSLVEYLTANDFECYVVSGSDRTLVRALIKDKLPIPENRVIGMSYTMVATGQQGDDGLQYLYSNDDEVILGGDLIIKTIKMNKVSEIALEIGKVPVLAFGNSSGDLSMAQYTVNNDEYEGRAYLVLCDDLEREHGNLDKADSLAKTCEESGFETISMKDDFATIYGDDVEITDYTYDEASAMDDDNKEDEEDKAEDKEHSDKAASVKDKYDEDEYPVFKGELTDEKIKIRYYEDTPNVAYAGIREYYDCIAEESLDSGKETMTVKKEDDGTYSLKSAHGEAVADIEKDTLTSEDLSDFTNIMCLIQEGMGDGYCDGLPYVKVKEMKSEGGHSVTLDLGKYDINIYGDDEDVYFPVSTLSDIFSDLDYHFSVFNGETFYFNSESYDKDHISAIDPDYAEPFLDKLGDDLELPEDLAEFSFNELCFSIDNFYGLPGKSLINDEVAEKGLVKALEDYGEEGEKTLELIKSQDLAEHLCGLEKLNLFLYDGGHTYINVRDFGDADTGDLSDRMDEIKEELAPDFEELEEDTLGEHKKRREYDDAKRKLREEAYGDDNYIKDGDTAVFVLDSFMGFNTEEWKKYYEEDGELPKADKDDMVRLKESLEDAKKDSKIKNFVLDLTNNRGGSLDEVAILYGLVTGKRELSCSWENTLTGEKVTETYEMDNNFDRKFDEKDESDGPDLNIAVLTSSASFSCGNAFPSLMKDSGYMVLGEKSGGGACAVLVQTTGEGMSYGISAFKARFINSKGEIIDEGVPVDTELIPKRSNGDDKFVTVKDVKLSKSNEVKDVRCPDYSGFYDTKKLSEEVNEFYKKAS